MEDHKNILEQLRDEIDNLPSAIGGFLGITPVTFENNKTKLNERNLNSLTESINKLANQAARGEAVQMLKVKLQLLAANTPYILGDVSGSIALSPSAKSGATGYRIKSVHTVGDDGKTIDAITVEDAELSLKAIDAYSGCISDDYYLQYDGASTHVYNSVHINGLSFDEAGCSVIGLTAPIEDSTIVNYLQSGYEFWIWVTHSTTDICVKGGEPVAEHEGAYAEGVGCISYGRGAHSEGNSHAIGNYAHGEGRNTRALGYAAHTEGNSTSARGARSHAEGWNSESDGNQSHAEGEGTKAIGLRAHSEGYYTRARGDDSHAEGVSCESIGKGSHAEGMNNTSTGQGSHSEGSANSVDGTASHTEGDTNKIINNSWAAHAEGRNNQIDGSSAAHVEGISNVINKGANFSHGEGQGNIISWPLQHIQGKYSEKSVWNGGNYFVHIIGWGSSDTDRKNIHTVDTQGNAWYAGKVSATGLNILYDTNRYLKIWDDETFAIKATGAAEFGGPVHASTFRGNGVEVSGVTANTGVFQTSLTVGGKPVLTDVNDDVVTSAVDRVMSEGYMPEYAKALSADSTYVLPLKNGGTGVSITDSSDLAISLGLVPGEYVEDNDSWRIMSKVTLRDVAISRSLKAPKVQLISSGVEDQNGNTILTQDGKSISAGHADIAGAISDDSTYILPLKNGGTGYDLTTDANKYEFAKAARVLPAEHRSIEYNNENISIWDVKEMTKFHAKAQVCDQFEILTRPDATSAYSDAFLVMDSGIQLLRGITHPLIMNTSTLMQNMNGDPILTMHTMDKTDANGECNRGLLVNYGCNFIVPKDNEYKGVALTFNYLRAAFNVPTTFGDHIILTSTNSGTALPTEDELTAMPEGAIFFQIVTETTN